MSQQPIFRFAPSPNGHMHLGHAFSALVTEALAKRFGGLFLIRLEDIDVSRCRPDFEAQILDDLSWLGLDWVQPVLKQSDRTEAYTSALAQLEALDLLYPCFATRREILDAIGSTGARPHLCDPDGAPLYPGLHKGLERREISERMDAGQPFALRLDMAHALDLAHNMIGGPLTFKTFDEQGHVVELPIDPLIWGDVVVARKDVPTSYHLSVVVDDAFQGISHVTRGEDLLASTAVHRLLQVLLRLPEPLYHHHGLVMHASGRKLSKSHEDKSIVSLRQQGFGAADIKRFCGFDAWLKNSSG